MFACLAGTAAGGQPPYVPALGLEQDAKSALRLAEATACRLSIAQAGADTWRVLVVTADESFAVRLWRHSVRHDGYRLIVHLYDGHFIEVPMTPVNTVRGIAEGDDGSLAAGGFVDGRLYLLVRRSDGTAYWLEPLGTRVDGAGEEEYVKYEAGSAAAAGVCATSGPTAWPGESGGTPLPRGPADDMYCAELACDSDFEFYENYGSIFAVEDRINLLTNLVNVQFESQVGVRHVLTAVVVRTTPSDPYWSTNSDTLLCQFINEWTNNQQAISFDLAKLFTGRDITMPDQNTVGQAATIGDVCDRQGFCNPPPAFDDGAFCMSQSDCCLSLSCATDLMAHELGHLWGATHCACPSHTMNATITCTNEFSAASIEAMIAHRNTRACLDDQPCAPAPVCGNNITEPGEECDDGNTNVGDGCNAACQIEDNNLCANALPIEEGTTTFSTFLATTDGPILPPACDEGFGLSFGQDIWFCYAAMCSGTATVSLCGSSYDTRLAAYSGCACPATNDRLIACGDDYCGLLALQSQVSFPVTAGQTYLIRVGGYGLDAGFGALTIVCGAEAGLCGNGVIESAEQCDPPDGESCGADCRWIVPANDSCQAAFSVECGVTIEASNALATPPAGSNSADAELPPESPSCQWNGTPDAVHNTLWYSFVASDTSVRIRTCGTPAGRDTILALYAGNCGELIEIACDDDGCGSSMDLESRICADGLTPGASYLLMVGNPGSWIGSVPGSFALGIDCPCPAIGTGLGACCWADDCQDLAPDACAGAGGAFAGTGTACATTPCGNEVCALPLGADLNGDGQANGRDVASFVLAVQSASTDSVAVCSADFDGNGSIGLADVPGFVGALLAD